MDAPTLLAVRNDGVNFTGPAEIEANDPKSGTAEFKATAVRLDKVSTSEPAWT